MVDSILVFEVFIAPEALKNYVLYYSSLQTGRRHALHGVSATTSGTSTVTLILPGGDAHFTE
jgi:hypothetical protein